MTDPHTKERTDLEKGRFVEAKGYAFAAQVNLPPPMNEQSYLAWFVRDIWGQRKDVVNSLRISSVRSTPMTVCKCGPFAAPCRPVIC